MDACLGVGWRADMASRAGVIELSWELSRGGFCGHDGFDYAVWM